MWDCRLMLRTLFGSRYLLAPTPVTSAVSLVT